MKLIYVAAAFAALWASKRIVEGWVSEKEDLVETLRGAGL